jgi:hypothetical protein
MSVSVSTGIGMSKGREAREESRRRGEERREERGGITRER